MHSVWLIQLELAAQFLFLAEPFEEECDNYAAI